MFNHALMQQFKLSRIAYLLLASYCLYFGTCIITSSFLFSHLHKLFCQNSTSLKHSYRNIVAVFNTNMFEFSSFEIFPLAS